MITRTCIKSRKPFLFRFRRWEILKRQNYAKNGLPNLQLAIRLKQANFENPTHNFDALVFPTPSSHSPEQLPTFYSVGIKCLKNETC